MGWYIFTTCVIQMDEIFHGEIFVLRTSEWQKSAERRSFGKNSQKFLP